MFKSTVFFIVLCSTVSFVQCADNQPYKVNLKKIECFITRCIREAKKRGVDPDTYLVTGDPGLAALAEQLSNANIHFHVSPLHERTSAYIQSMPASRLTKELAVLFYGIHLTTRTPFINDMKQHVSFPYFSNRLDDAIRFHDVADEIYASFLVQ
jgi:hypothetical protein